MVENNIKKLREDIDAKIKNIMDSKVSKNLIIVFIDLTGSTKIKLVHGQEYGIEKSLEVIFLSDQIVKENNGTVIKELGDGVLCTFYNPVDACKAALQIKELAYQFDFKITAGITCGFVELINLTESKLDIFGSPVDRCARITSCANPMQILIDQSFLGIAESKLIDDGISISRGNTANLKGLRDTELFEISAGGLTVNKGYCYHFKIHEEGRISPSEKTIIMAQAKQRIVKIGLAMRTLTKSFTGERPGKFREHIETLLKKKVDFEFYLIDPNWEGTKLYFSDRNEVEYVDDIQKSIDALKREKINFNKKGLEGKFDIYTYQNLPSMNMMCIDPDEVDSRMVVTPYLCGLRRSECPVFEFTKQSHRKWFETYWKGFDILIRERSKPVE